MIELFLKIQKSFFVKIIILFLLVVFVTPFALPPQAEAQYPVFDAAGAALKVTGNAILGVINTISTAVIGTGVQALVTKEYILGPLATSIAKMILRGITASILAWVNNGFQGNPSFIQNPKQFFTNMADQIVGSLVLNDPRTAWMCSPFALNIKRALIYNRSFAQRSQCSLAGIVNNFQAFASGANNQLGNLGGWNAWNTLTYEPQNNPYGAYSLLNMQVEASIAGNFERKNAELTWGRGFLTWKDPSCVATRQAAQTASNDLTSAGADNSGASQNDIEAVQERLAIAGGNTDTESCSTLTPGSVIADQVNKTLGSGQDQLVSAQEINQVVSTLMYQLAVKALGGSGLFGLGSSAGGNYSSGSSYAGQIVAQDQQILETNKTDLVNRINDRIQVENSYVATKNQSLSRIGISEDKAASVIACYTSSSTIATIDSSRLASFTASRPTDLRSASSSLTFIIGYTNSIARDIAIAEINLRNYNRLIDYINAITYSTRNQLQEAGTQFSQLFSRGHSEGDGINAQFERDTTIPDAMKDVDIKNDERVGRCLNPISIDNGFNGGSGI